MRILLLGGTMEARALAAALHPDVGVISSLAGRVPDPAPPVGQPNSSSSGRKAVPNWNWEVSRMVPSEPVEPMMAPNAPVSVSNSTPSAGAGRRTSYRPAATSVAAAARPWTGRPAWSR